MQSATPLHAGLADGAAASAAAGGFEALLLTLVAIVAATKLFGALAQRIGQPAVLGELLAGVLLGASGLAVLNPANEVLHALSELGIIILLFEIGLQTDLRALARVGSAASTVGLVGVVLPFAGGYAAGTALGLAQIPALVVGAALTATSIGISARVLSDLGLLGSDEGQVTLGAAVLDDVVGLVILAVISGLVAGTSLSAFSVTRIAAVAAGFVVAALVIGGALVRPYLRAADRLSIPGATGVLAFAAALGLAWLAARAGSAMIVGAFAAGVIAHPTRQRAEIQAFTTTLGRFFVPIFFASVGAAVELRALADPRALMLGASLIAVGVAGKIAAGYSPWWFQGNKLLVGVAMVPRGEVGLIFAQMGLAAGAISQGEFGALMLMVLVTTFVTPPLLGFVARRAGRVSAAEGLAPRRESGIDALVVGDRERREVDRSLL